MVEGAEEARGAIWAQDLRGVVAKGENDALPMLSQCCEELLVAKMHAIEVANCKRYRMGKRGELREVTRNDHSCLKR